MAHMAHFGNLLLFIAAAAVLLTIVSYTAVWRGRTHLAAAARASLGTSSLCVSLAVALLWYLFLTHDFTVAYVASYSSTDLPLHYLISALWAGQEGTFLLWLFFVQLFGLLIVQRRDSFEPGVMVFVSLFSLALLLMLIARSPFALADFVLTDGRGLNPLLRDFWMTIHPPIMFVGFAGVVIPFAYAMTALVDRRYHEWLDAARPWTLITWAAIAISLVMGGYWAYKTLGWGGYWAWDPVENSSLIPWILLTVLLHTLFVSRRRQALLRFAVVMAALAFSSVLYGTFLTRSGVLADFSVHSFVNLGINSFLVAALGGFVLLGLVLLLWRWRDIPAGRSYTAVASRTWLLVLGVLVLFTGSILVLAGTSAPLLSGLFGDPFAVDIDYYTRTMTPVAVSVLTLLAMFPAFRWNHGLARQLLLAVGLLTGLVVALVLVILEVTWNLGYLALIVAAIAAACSNAPLLIERLRDRRSGGAFLAHVGLAVALIGAVASSGLSDSRTLTLSKSDSANALGYHLTYTGFVETPLGFDCLVTVNRGEDTLYAHLPHEFPANSDQVMRRPWIHKSPLQDVYLAPLAFSFEQLSDPGRITLALNETIAIDKYTFRFFGFEVPEHHYKDARAIAVVEVTYGEHTETLRPQLLIEADTVVATKEIFNQGYGRLGIAAVDPNHRSVVLAVSGPFLPPADTIPESLTVDISTKPLINFFWLGTALMIIGGLWSAASRRRRPTDAPDPASRKRRAYPQHEHD
jgi:cytochrome c-type biogenesis protein CcmF